MTKRFHFILLMILMAFFFGCATDDNSGKQIKTEASEAVTHSEVNNNESEEDITKQSNEQDTNKNPLEKLLVHYIDADQGDATLFQYDDFTILYDTGDWKNENVINYLHEISVNQIDLIIISHPHADHIGQLDKIIDAFPVSEVWMTENTASTTVFQRAINAILNNDIDFYNPQVGETFDIGEMELVILHPDELTGDLNQDSISIRFTYGDISFVFTGDAYKEQEKLIVQNSDSLTADFLQLGHHGSNTSSDPSFIETVNPTYAIYSAGANNSYGHPHDEVINYFQDKNITLLGTDTHGTITITTDGNTYDVKTEKNGLPIKQKKELPNKQEEPTTKLNTNDNCIDINNASQSELTNITHIGDARANDIINNRPYDSVDDLIKVNGIGDTRLNDIKDEGLACVN